MFGELMVGEGQGYNMCVLGSVFGAGVLAPGGSVNIINQVLTRSYHLTSSTDFMCVYIGVKICVMEV